MKDVDKYLNQVQTEIITEIKKLGSDRSNYIVNPKTSLKWLYETISELDKNSNKITDKIVKIPGYFYIMKYESYLYNTFFKTMPKKRKLEFYDVYPLVLVLKKEKDSFLAFNFHYIHPMYRALILRKLIKVYGKKFMNDTRLMPMNYDLFKTMLGSRLWKYAKHGIKRYIFDNLIKLKGFSTRRINNTDMVNSIFYVSPEWKGIKEMKIWKDSLKG